jgi:TonB-linked SusC/RagA family outer membrane protein
MKRNACLPTCQFIRIAFLLTIVFLLTIQANARSQDITLSVTNYSLKDALLRIGDQAAYDVFYDVSLFKLSRPVTLHLRNTPVRNALDSCFQGQPLDYYLQGSTIFVIRKPEHPPAASPADLPPSHEISGVVVNEQNEPMAGVTVWLKGSKTGTQTNDKGEFHLTVPDKGAVLAFSFVGFANKEMPVGDKTDLRVSMLAASSSLSDVVVVGIGYGSLQSREVTSAISHVSSKDMLAGGNNDPLMGVQGKVPGLTVANTAAGDPNSTATLQLRGVSSRIGGLTPLYVINGVPGGNIDNINQNDIESIDVLKGGAASAIYGTRGSNGVILITTKRATSQSQTLYDVYGTMGFATNTLKVLSRDAFLAHNRGFDAGANTDWLKATTRRPDFSQKHTLQFSGGSDKDNFLATMDYRNANGLDLRATKQEYGARLNLNHNSANKLFSAAVSVAPRYAKINTADQNQFNWALTLNPTLPIYDSVGNYKYTNGGLFAANPVEQAKLILAQQELKELDINGSFRVNILSNLNTIVTIGEVGKSMKTLDFTPSTLTTQQLINGGSGRNKAHQKQEEWDQKSLEWVGNYNLEIKKHSVKLLGGYSFQYFNYKEFEATNEGMPFDAVTWNNLGSGLYDQQDGVVNVGSDQNSSKLVAFFGRLTYDFNKRYFLTASLRHEGSTKFGEGRKWGDFPAVSAGWILSDEPFLHLPWLKELKLRGDYGVTGNQDFDNYQSLLTYGGYGFYPYNGTTYQVYGPSQNVNPYLHWEKAINFNGGLDFALLDNRLSGSVNYYTRTNKDLLGSYNVPVPPNLQGTTYVNVGTMKNSGIEVQLTATAVRTKNFRYDISFAGSTNNNKFVSFSNEVYNGGTFQDGVAMPAPGSPGNLQRLQEGVRVGSYYTLHAAGVDNTGALQVFNKKGEVITATQANNDDRRFAGNGLPKFMASLGNSFRYKNWDLGIFLRGNFGYKIFNTTAFYLGTPAQQMNVNLLTSAYDPKSRYSRLTNPSTVAILSDYFLEPGAFVKLDNVTLGYTRDLHMPVFKSVHVYLTGRNLHTFTKFTGGDPDLIPVTGLWPGVNNTLSYYPSALQLLLGVQVRF